MNWQTEQEARAAGEGTEKEAAVSSLEHWRQGARCTYEEFLEARPTIKFHTGPLLCALCYHHESCCGGCVLRKNEIACCREHSKVRDAFLKFSDDCSRDNFGKFQSAAEVMCKRLEKEIAKMSKSPCMTCEHAQVKKDKKKQSRHGDYGLTVDDRPFLITKSFFGGDDSMRVASQEGLLETISMNNLSGMKPKTTFGNIYDDMERNKEDLEEFTINGQVRVKRDMDCISIAVYGWLRPLKNVGHVGQGWNLNLAEAVEYHQKLGRVIATIKRKNS